MTSQHLPIGLLIKISQPLMCSGLIVFLLNTAVNHHRFKTHGLNRSKTILKNEHKQSMLKGILSSTILFQTINLLY